MQSKSLQALVLLSSVLLLVNGIGLVLMRYEWTVGLVLISAIFGVGLIKPELTFSFLYPLLMPIGQMPLSLGVGMASVTVSLERVLVLIGSVGLVGGVFVTRRLRIIRPPTIVIIGAALWLIAYSVSFLVFPSETGAVIVFGFAQKVLLSFMVMVAIAKPERLQIVLAFFLFASFLISLAPLVAFLQEESLQFIRASSFTVEEEFSASLFRGIARAGAGNVMALWVTLAFLWQSRTNVKRMLFLGLALWFVAISLFALRREVLVAIPMGLAVLVWRMPKKSRRQIILIATLILLIMLIFVQWSPEWSSRIIGETVTELSSGTDARMVLLLRFTPGAFMLSPWIGHGPGNYATIQLTFPELVTPIFTAVGGAAPHNSWSASIVEAGIFAFIGLCVFLYGIGRPLLTRRTFVDAQMEKIWLIAPLIFVQLLNWMFFGHGLIMPMVWFWLGFLLALEHVTREIEVSRSV